MSLESKLASLNLVKIPKGESTTAYVLSQLPAQQRDSFSIMNVSAIERCYKLWKSQLPEVVPHYAIKCNPHPTLIKTMAALGAGFDCASPAELKIALSTGSPRVIYANPQKTPKMISEAYTLNCDTFTFDSEEELRKMIACTPEGKIGKFVLRLLPPDESCSICKFGVKFGANEQEAERLVRLALQLQKENKNFELVGLSFHVGSGCGSTKSFALAVQFAGRIAKLSQSLGNEMCVLDLGGGYMTTASEKHYEEVNKKHGICPPSFEDIAACLREEIGNIKQYFSKDLYQLAEPGRFFAGDSMTLAIKVFGKRVIFNYKGKQVQDYGLTEQELKKQLDIQEIKYYVGDGLYGWFNAIIFDHVCPYLEFYREGKPVPAEPQYTSHVFGPTCDSMDCIIQDQKVQELEIGDWLVAPAFGAYTAAAATEFNGIPYVNVVNVIEE